MSRRDERGSGTVLVTAAMAEICMNGSLTGTCAPSAIEGAAELR